MIEAPHYSPAGAKRTGAFALPADVFDGTVNEPVLHQAVKVYLNNQRQGTAKTKTRSFVSGGNQKPWKQKGTGRARQGSTRAPHWRGGGIVFGPIPRDYRTDIPRKVRAARPEVGAQRAGTRGRAPRGRAVRVPDSQDRRGSRSCSRASASPTQGARADRGANEALTSAGATCRRSRSCRTPKPRRTTSSGRMRSWSRKVRSRARRRELAAEELPSRRAEKRTASRGGEGREGGEEDREGGSAEAGQGEGGQDRPRRRRRPRPTKAQGGQEEHGQVGEEGRAEEEEGGQVMPDAAPDDRPAGGDREELGRLSGAQGVRLRGASGGQQAPDPRGAAEALRGHGHRVRTMQMRRHAVTRGRTRGTTARWKKAIVTLKDGDSIAVFEG